MKNKILSIVLLCFFSLHNIYGSYLPSSLQNLSKKEMSLIAGGGDPCKDAILSFALSALQFSLGNVIGGWLALMLAIDFQNECQQQGGGGGGNGDGGNECAESGGYCSGSDENIYGGSCGGQSYSCGAYSPYCCHD